LCTKKYHNFHLARIIYLMSHGEGRNKWIHLFICVLYIQLPYSYSQSTATAITFFKRPRSLQWILTRSLASVRYSSFIAHVHENVSRMVNPLCASIPRGIDFHGKAVHGHGYTGGLQRNVTDTLPVQSTRSGRSPLETRTATDADSVFTRARNNSSPVLSPRPRERYQVNVNCAMNLRGSVYSRGGRVTLADLVRSSLDTPD